MGAAYPHLPAPRQQAHLSTRGKERQRQHPWLLVKPRSCAASRRDSPACRDPSARSAPSIPALPGRSPHPIPTERWWDTSQGLPSPWTPAGNPICLRLPSMAGACRERPRQARLGGAGRTWERALKPPPAAPQHPSTGVGRKWGSTGKNRTLLPPSAPFCRKRHHFLLCATYPSCGIQCPLTLAMRSWQVAPSLGLAGNGFLSSGNPSGKALGEPTSPGSLMPLPGTRGTAFANT